MGAIEEENLRRRHSQIVELEGRIVVEYHEAFRGPVNCTVEGSVSGSDHKGKIVSFAKACNYFLSCQNADSMVSHARRQFWVPANL